MLHPIARSLIADPSPEAVEVALDLYREGKWGRPAPHELYLITGDPGPLAVALALAREEGGERAEQSLLCQLAELQLRELAPTPPETWPDAARRGVAGPLWEHLLPYAAGARLILGGPVDRPPTQVRILRMAARPLPDETWLRLWPGPLEDPAPCPCVEPVVRYDGLELAPPTGERVVPLANAARAVAYVCQCAPAPWGPLLDAAVEDRRRADPFEINSRLTGDEASPGYRWGGLFTPGRWLEVRQVSATEAEISWDSGTGEPSRYLGQALAYAGLLGLPPRPPSPPFGVLASAMRRAMVAEERERRG